MELSFRNLFIVDKSKFPEEKIIEHETHHKKYSWVYFACMVPGLWLIAAPLTFGYKFSPSLINDLISGIALIILSWLSLNPYRLWAQWLLIFLGLWLFIAPIIFWAREPATYLNDTLIAIFVVSLGIIIPGQPGIKLFEQNGPNVPPGWSYNPSSWTERIPVITLAWFGFFISEYLAAYQLGYLNNVWDPFFDDGTKNVLTSDVSRAFPVSDAALGAFAYILDVLMGYVGNTHRWRTMSWVVIIFGILIIPLGVVSITLVILQPVAVGYWCSLCLFTAFVSLLMIPFTLDEVLATIQLLKYETNRGKSFWKIFWFGGTMEGGALEDTPDAGILISKTGKSLIKDIKNKPLNLFLCTIVGFWIMAAPGVLHFSGSFADSNHITGALVATFAVIAMSEVARPARFINILFATWLLASPWILDSNSTQATTSSLISGVIILILSFHKGKVKDKRGKYDKYIF